ncbi:MAG: FG-GAP-like repeat-containing protein, partial [Ignavibacteria bacterium]|nr:FG-GAP-like repeat-containing protein [Ignavibacteria bacterium]
MNKILVFLFVLIPALASSQWLPDLRLTNAAGNSNLSHNSQRCIGAYENNVHIVWFDDRDGNQEIYYKNSSNNGMTWSADLRLTNNASSSYLPSLNVSGQLVRVVWDDNRDGNREIYYKYSSNSGTSWSADIRLTNNTGQSYAPNISSSGQNLHLVWIENRDGNPEIYYKRSTDGGTTWSADVRLTNNSAASESPNVAVYGQTVYVIWDDGRDGSTEIYYKSSSDGGINWGTDIRLSDLPNDSGYPSFAIYDQNLHVVLYDRRDGNAEIYYKRSVNGGAAWSADIRLTNASNDSYFNNIEVYGQIVHAVWHDYRDGNAEIYYKRSMDGGTTWGTDVRLTNQSAASVYPFIALSRQFVHVAFYDNRDANYEVYYKQNPIGNAVAAVDSGSFRNKSNVPLASDYKAYFNQNMNSSTITSGSIVSWGSMTGKKQGNLTYNSGEKSVTINPVNDFKYGELIMTTLTPMIRTSADYNILPYVWSFTSMTKPSYAVFNKTDSVTTVTNPHKIINGDIDGDGDIDIAVTNTGSNSVSILKNNGNGIFTVTSNVSLSFGPFVIASGDFDNDTDLDLAVSGGNTVTVLANNGSGAFSVFSGTGLNESGHIVPADFDGDGDLDLAVTCRGPNSASILRNNGSGTFAVLSSYSLNSPQGVTAGDLDKDGDIDL